MANPYDAKIKDLQTTLADPFRFKTTEDVANMKKYKSGQASFNANQKALNSGGGVDNTIYSSDGKIAQGQQVGRQRFEQNYGQKAGQTGKDIQDVKGKLKDRMNTIDPISGQQQNAMNRSLRRMKSQGATDQQVQSASRTNALNYSNDAYGRQGTAINDYRSLLGNLLSGSQNLEMGFAGLEKSGQVVRQPRYSSGGLSVICTELHRQGLMSDELYEKDQEYGRHIWDNHIFMFVGYLFWARYFVGLMQKSPLFTKFVTFFTLAWANRIAGNKTILGSFMKFVGEPTCNIIGNLVIWGNKWNISRIN